MMRKENEIEMGLKLSEKLFKQKYRNKKLSLCTFGGADVITNQLKKIIIATEICTLKWALKRGGTLNALNKEEWVK
jgi:hypothetical protein